MTDVCVGTIHREASCEEAPGFVKGSHLVLKNCPRLPQVHALGASVRTLFENTPRFALFIGFQVTEVSSWGHKASIAAMIVDISRLG